MVAGHMVCGLVERTMFGRPAVFVDRDDTLARDVPYCSDPDDLELFDGVPVAVRRLNDAGYLVIMVTNQSGVARGYFDEATLNAIHDKVRGGLAAAGARLDAIYRCPHLPDAGCDCRKPGIGMVMQALDDFPIDLSSSYVIGDSDMDMEMADRVGAKGIQVGSGFDFTTAVDRILG